MKKQILGLVFGVLILPYGMMAQDHTGHNMDMKNDGTTSKRYDVSADFQKQLKSVYQASLELNKAFVAGDAATVKEKGVTMVHRVTEVDMTLLEGEVHMVWMNYMKSISDGLDNIIISNDIETQRKEYGQVSEGLYKAVKSFGVGETVYYQYCPMAKSSWLNNGNEVNNPYYGGKMLKCGSTKEVLN